MNPWPCWTWGLVSNVIQPQVTLNSPMNQGFITGSYGCVHLEDTLFEVNLKSNQSEKRHSRVPDFKTCRPGNKMGARHPANPKSHVGLTCPKDLETNKWVDLLPNMTKNGPNMENTFFLGEFRSIRFGHWSGDRYFGLPSADPELRSRTPIRTCEAPNLAGEDQGWVGHLPGLRFQAAKDTEN